MKEVNNDKPKFTKANNKIAMEMIRKSPLEVKAIKTFRGHDGEGYNCNIYWNGKKIGYANDFANGGELETEFYYNGKHSFDFSPLDELIDSLPKGSWFEYSVGYGANWNIDGIVNFLVFDKLNERDMKKMLKKVACFNPKNNKLSSWNIPPMNYSCVKYNFKEEKNITLEEYMNKYKKDTIVLNTLPFDVCMEYWYMANPNTI
jgi:hypothetical protein